MSCHWVGFVPVKDVVRVGGAGLVGISMVLLEGLVRFA